MEPEVSFKDKLGILLHRTEQMGESLIARLMRVKEGGMKSVELATLYADVRLAHDGIEEATKKLKGLKEQLKALLLPEAFDRDEIKTLTLEDGHRITIGTRVVASIIPDSKPLAFTWLRTNNHGSLIQETVNAQTLGAFARAEMEAARELPDNLFKVTVLHEASFTKGKG